MTFRHLVLITLALGIFGCQEGASSTAGNLQNAISRELNSVLTKASEVSPGMPRESLETVRDQLENLQARVADARLPEDTVGAVRASLAKVRSAIDLKSVQDSLRSTEEQIAELKDKADVGGKIRELEHAKSDLERRLASARKAYEQASEAVKSSGYSG